MTAAPAGRPLVMSRKRWTGWPSRRPVAHLVARAGDARALCGRPVADWCGVLPGVQPAPLCRACRRAAEKQGGG